MAKGEAETSAPSDARAGQAMPGSAQRARGPLAGVRVLDLSRLLPGPFATMVLTELGAEVDKIEDPIGDYLRALPPHQNVETSRGSEAMSTAFVALNQGKRSACLDLKQADARATLIALLPHYDILLEQFRPGVLARLGLSEETLFAANPELIVCSMSGYGQTGPLAHRAGHDLNYLARAGVLGLQGHPDGVAPAPYSVQIADIGGALYGVIAVLAALHERNAARARGETWRGRVLDIALADSALSFALTGLAAHHGGEDPRAGAHPLAGSIAPYRVYETADGRFMALGALEPKFWIAFTQAVGLPSEMEALSPGPHQAGWIARVADVFRAKSFREWSALAAQTDFCLEPVLEPGELAQDAHWQARGLLQDGAVQTPAALAFARLRGPGPDAGPSHDRARAPAQGEHTAQILSKSAR